MVTFDTNVALRLVVRDDTSQCARAERAWRAAVEHGGVFLTATVLIEIGWVLRSAFKFDRAIIATTLRHLVDSHGVTTENETVVRRALARYEQGPVGFSDCVILESARAADALPVLTFDEGFAPADGVELVPPAEDPAS